MTRKLLLVLVSCTLFFTLAAQSDKSYRAERFDVVVDALPDGSLSVQETVTFQFAGGPFSYVFRELPTDHTDGIVDIAAGVDGVPWPMGDGPGEVEITGRNPIEVTWHLSPTSNTTQTFTLFYRPLGVVRRGDAADVLDWQALPDEYDYEIDNSRLTIIYPPGGRLNAEPEVRAGNAAITTETDRVHFDMQSLSPGDPLVVRLPFTPGAFTAELPTWQTRQSAQDSRAWIWFVAAAAVLAGGILAFNRAAQPFIRSLPKANSYLYKPPLDLPPAMAGYVANQTVGWQYGLATLFDLAARGFIQIEQITEKTTFRSPEFTVTLLERPQQPRPHEQSLLDLLFIDKQGVEQEVVTLGEMGKLITSSRWKEFSQSLEDEAAQEGLLDNSAKKRQKRIIGWGAVLMVAAIPLLLAAFLLRDTFGMWTLVAVGAVFLIGFLGFLFGASISPLSNKGFQISSAFEPFHHLLKDVAKGKTTLPDLTYFEAYLPYATAYGLAEPWVKGQAKSDYQQIPAYFRAAGASGGEMAAFVSVISTASRSGGAAAASAGAAGAGAAGGGASGAG